MMVPRLSPLISPGTENFTSTSLNQLCIQTICCANQDIATYSASTVDRATVVWHLLLQVTGDEHYRALRLLTSYFAIYSTYQLHKLHQSLALYLGNLYHQILLDYPTPTHFKSRISDQNCQRYATSPFSSVKASHFTSSRRSQEQYLLDNRSYGDLVLLYIPIKTNLVAFQ